MIVLFSKVLNYILCKLDIFILYRDGKAIGDQLCMTAIVETIYQEYGFKTIVFTNYPEIFFNNPNVSKIIDVKKNKFLFRIIRKFKGKQIENFLFENGLQNFEDYMRNTKNKMHLVQIHSKHFLYKINSNDLKCHIYFNDEEIKELEMKFQLPLDFAIIQPVGKTSYTLNKEWGIVNYQEVVDNTKNINFLQIGLLNDKLLNNVIDFRDKTSLRELFFLVSKANFIIGNEGILNHIASAFNIPSIVIFSGFSNIELALYKNTIAIYEKEFLDCKPCWKYDCDIIGKPCMQNITPDIVVKKIESIL